MKAWRGFTAAWTMAFVAVWLDFAGKFYTHPDALSWAIDFMVWATPPALFYLAGLSAVMSPLSAAEVPLQEHVGITVSRIGLRIQLPSRRGGADSMPE